MGRACRLGFFEKESLIRTKLQVTTAPFPIQGCGGGRPAAAGLPAPPQGDDRGEQEEYPDGERRAAVRLEFADRRALRLRRRLLRARADQLRVAAFPAEPRDQPLTARIIPGGSAGAEDIYQAMKTWFFLEEPIVPGVDVDGNPTPAHLNSFTRNLGTYVNVQTNTYIQGISGLYELLIIADQLAQSPQLSEMDADLGKSKQAVAAEMRGFILQSLKELLGQWADVYTAQFFQYNSQYNSFLGYPEGFGSVQNFNDHHFHYGYFLRAAVAVGRYDRDWLTQYLPLIDEIRRDVATYDRADTKYPFLREFSPFYGHNWADGTGQDGNNQESVSEAMNFSYGLIELGQVLGDQKLRDLGIYMLEEEILAAEQYWFNQEADLAKSSGRALQRQLARLARPLHGAGRPAVEDDPRRQRQTGRRLPQYLLRRHPGRLHDPADADDAPYSLFFGRNQNWLKETWKQYLLDSAERRRGLTRQSSRPSRHKCRRAGHV